MPEWLRLVWKQVESLRYGVVQVVVQDGQVVQVDRTERVRLTKPVARYDAHPENVVLVRAQFSF